MIEDIWPGSVYIPAHPDNIRPGTNDPKILVIHTPEEKADETEVTPHFFSHKIFITLPDGRVVQRRASTNNYISGGLGTLGNGQMYQMVRYSECAIANGLLGKPQPADTDPSLSLNCQSENIEVEGYAANMHISCPRGSLQWNGLVEWVEVRSEVRGIPLDRAHVLRHDEIANNRTDPGTLGVSLVVADAKLLRERKHLGLILEGDEDMMKFIALKQDERTGEDDDWVYQSNGIVRKRMHRTADEAAIAFDIPRTVVHVTRKLLDDIKEIEV